MEEMLQSNYDSIYFSKKIFESGFLNKEIRASFVESNVCMHLYDLFNFHSLGYIMLERFRTLVTFLFVPYLASYCLNSIMPGFFWHSTHKEKPETLSTKLNLLDMCSIVTLYCFGGFCWGDYGYFLDERD